MARSKKPPGGACAAKRELQITNGLDFSKDFHALSRSNVDDLLAYARLYKYRKRKNAPGSTARMFYQHLQRTKCRR